MSLSDLKAWDLCNLKFEDNMNLSAKSLALSSYVPT